jgi:RNA polymerase sigma factor (sigma-70 family)
VKEDTMATAAPQPDGDITRLLGQFRNGDLTARDRLIEFTYDRFDRLTRQMLNNFRGLRRWEQTKDVFHKALIRLLTAMEEVRPESSAHFLHLAAMQIRRELHDLCRHYFGPCGPAAHHDTGRGEADPAEGVRAGEPHPDGGRDSDGPSTLAEWTEFHEAVAALPEDLRVVVELHWYTGLTHEQVAEITRVDVRTAKRRWRHARRLLGERFRWLAPGGDGT